MVTYPRAPARITAITSSGAVGDREREKALGRTVQGNPADHLDAPASRHVHVEQHHFGLGRENRLLGVLHGAGVAEDPNGSLELCANPRAEQVVVIHDHDAWPLLRCHCDRSSLSSISVP